MRKLSINIGMRLERKLRIQECHLNYFCGLRPATPIPISTPIMQDTVSIDAEMLDQSFDPILRSRVYA